MSRILELAPDVFAISDTIVADERVSWIPHGSRGYEPHNQYLVRTADTALMIDTGLPLHGESVVSALQTLVGQRELVTLTTRSEPDCVGNLADIARAFPKLRVMTTSALNPAQIVHLHDGSRLEDIPFRRLKFNETLASLGMPHLRIVDPVMRLLGTCWIVDEMNSVLFSSDYLGVELIQSPDAPFVRDTLDGQPDVAAVRAGILAKFSWVAHADTDVLSSRWDTFFAATKPKVIAPSQGLVVMGRDIVVSVLDCYRRAAFEPVRARKANA